MALAHCTENSLGEVPEFMHRDEPVVAHIVGECDAVNVVHLHNGMVVYEPWLIDVDNVGVTSVAYFQ